MTPKEFAKLQRNYLIRTEKQSAVLIASEFEAVKRDLQKFLIENARREATIKNLYADSFLERLLLFIDNQLDFLSIPFSRIVSRGQKLVINFTSKILADYLSLDASIFSPDKEAIRILIGRTQTGETLQKYFLRMKPEIAEKAKQTLIEGFALGESNSQIAKRITDVSDVSRYKAMRISRTETNEAYRTATREFYEGADVKKYVWQSVRDSRTCLICWTLHNRVFKTSKKVFSHPNCRCVLLPFFDGDEKIGSNDDFLKLETGFQRQILGPKRFELFQSGKFKIEDFVKSQNSKEFGEKFSIKNLSEFEN